MMGSGENIEDPSTMMLFFFQNTAETSTGAENEMPISEISKEVECEADQQ